MKSESIIKKSSDLSGETIELYTKEGSNLFFVGTRWAVLAKLGTFAEADLLLQGLEFMEAATKAAAKAILAEVKRVPCYQFGDKRNTHSRVMYLVECAEKRLSGLRPYSCGSKGSVIVWK